MPKVTALTAQLRSPGRVNVFLDGKFSFSLDVTQIIEWGLATGKDITDAELEELRTESDFGKLYTRSLEYALTRPRSQREMKDYLWKKTRPVRKKDGSTKEGMSQAVADRVLERLIERGYVDDEKFARFWIDNRNVRKGTSFKKLTQELRQKGVEPVLIESLLGSSERTNEAELRKILQKKRSRYDDPQKLIAYLQRLGFSYSDITDALREDDELEDV